VVQCLGAFFLREPATNAKLRKATANVSTNSSRTFFHRR
jgi:hypothetical protein